jgi:hypothetical protein
MSSQDTTLTSSSAPYDVGAMLAKRARTHTAPALSAAAKRHVSHPHDHVTNSSSNSSSSSSSSSGSSTSGGSSVHDEQFEQEQQQQERTLGVTVSSEPTVTSPLVCIALGDSLLFDISKGCYPVYQRDSLLNSNPHFDYGAFRDLATHMTAAAAGGNSSSALYATFGFAFTAPGSYVFSSSCDAAVSSSTVSSGTVAAAAAASLAVVAVMRADTACTTPSQFVPLTTSALVSLGIAKQDAGLTLTPDWALIGGLLVSVRRVTFSVLRSSLN